MLVKYNVVNNKGEVLINKNDETKHSFSSAACFSTFAACFSTFYNNISNKKLRENFFGKSDTITLNVYLSDTIKKNDINNYKISDEDLDWFINFCKENFNIVFEREGSQKDDNLILKITFDSKTSGGYIVFVYHLMRLCYEKTKNFIKKENNINYLQKKLEELPNFNFFQIMYFTYIKAVKDYDRQLKFHLIYNGHKFLEVLPYKDLSKEKLIENIELFKYKESEEESIFSKIYYSFLNNIFENEKDRNIIRMEKNEFLKLLSEKNIDYEGYKSICGWE